MKTIHARVEALYIADDGETFVTRQVPELSIELGGIPGDRHYGLLRPADSRMKAFYPRGEMVANRRQISAVSVEELAAIAQALGVPEVKPEWLGANLLISGCPELTRLPQGARLLFQGGAGLISEGENPPCLGPGELIEEACGIQGLAPKFVSTAKKRRGIVASVEREGQIRQGDGIKIVMMEPEDE